MISGIKKALVGSTLFLPLVGCNDDNSPEKTPAVAEKQTTTQEIKEEVKKITSLKDPTIEYLEIWVADANNDEVISPEEADKYASEVMDADKDKKLSYKELKYFCEVVNYLEYISDLNPSLETTSQNLRNTYDRELAVYNVARTNKIEKEIEKLEKESTPQDRSPLKTFSNEIDLIHLFDRNVDGQLDLSEVDLYVKVMIDKDKDSRLSSEERKAFVNLLIDLHRLSITYPQLKPTYENFNARYRYEIGR